MRHCQDEPPAKKQLKARPCEGLSAVQPEKQPRGRVKWKMKSFQQIVTSLPKQQACNKGDSHMLVNDKNACYKVEIQFSLMKHALIRLQKAGRTVALALQESISLLYVDKRVVTSDQVFE